MIGKILKFIFAIDLNKKLVELGQNYAIAEGVATPADFFVKDIFKAALCKATVVTMYLLNGFGLELRPKLLNGLKPGAWIVSHDFQMKIWLPDRTVRLDLPKGYQMAGKRFKITAPYDPECGKL